MARSLKVGKIVEKPGKDLSGIDGAMMDTRGAEVVVRVPMVTADLEFVAGNY